MSRTNAIELPAERGSIWLRNIDVAKRNVSTDGGVAKFTTTDLSDQIHKPDNAQQLVGHKHAIHKAGRHACANSEHLKPVFYFSSAEGPYMPGRGILSRRR